MLIYSMKPDHDGGVAIVDSDSQDLLLAYEAEKDSFPRYEVFNPVNMLEAAGRLDRFPEVFAISGWSKGGLAANCSIGAGYDGVDRSDRQNRWASVFGQKVIIFSSTHALSHIWSSYGMSPYEQGKPCYALIWEGALGDFFEIDAQLEVHHLGQVMKTPGNKYSFLYALADPTFTLPRGQVRYGDPGKLMALCAYGESGKPNAEEWELIDALLNHTSFLSLAKDDLRDSPLFADQIVILNPGAKHEARMWPLSEWVSLAYQITNSGFAVCFTGGPAEAHLIGELQCLIEKGRASGTRKARILLSINQLSFKSLIGLFNRAVCYIGPDTGTSHLAYWLGTPTIILLLHNDGTEEGDRFGDFFPYPDNLLPTPYRCVCATKAKFHMRDGSAGIRMEVFAAFNELIEVGSNM